MVRKSSLYLFIKQGIKGVLKFKIQFIIIIILSFLSTLMLTISMSVSDRLQSNYNQTMDKMDKFDYVQQKTVGINKEGLSESSNVPIMDFVNNQFLRIENSSNPNEISSNYGLQYNVNLSNFKLSKDLLGYDTYYDTFITKTFKDPDIQDAFIEMVSNPEYYKSFFEYKYDPKTEKITYNPESCKILNYDNTLISYLNSCASKVQKDFFEKTVQELQSNFVDDLFSRTQIGYNYLKNTPYALLLENGKLNKEELEIHLTDGENRNLKLKYTNYLYFALETIVISINSMVVDYITYYTNQAVNYNYKEGQRPENSKQMRNEFNKHIFEKAGFEWKNNNNQNLDLAFLLFTYIFGNEYDGTKYKVQYDTFKNTNTKNNNMLVTDSNLPWIQKIDYSPNSEIVYNEKILSSKQQLYEKGARGSLVQIIGNTDQNGKVVGQLNVSSNAKILKHENTGESLNYRLARKSNFNSLSDRQNYSLNQVHNGEKIYTLRNEILADAVNLDYQVRGEVLLADNATETKYRIVNLDYYWEDKLTLYEGNMPRTSNEVLINAQYAKANKLKLGQNITIGGNDFVISGFASDPLTYFPISELTVPLPNNKTSAVIYTYHDVIKQKIVTNDHSKYATNYFYNILTKTDQTQNVNESMALFSVFNFYNIEQANYNLDEINKYFNSDQTISYNSSITNEKYSHYNNSPLKMNWELTPILIKSFQQFVYIACSIILLISLIAVVVAVKKTTELNSKEIATLKSMGAKSYEISISYISYGIVIMLFVVPLGWLLGSFLQEFITKIFLSYAGGTYNLMHYSFYPFLICFLIFGVFICIVSYLTALIINRKTVLKIFAKTEKVKRIAWIDSSKNYLLKNKKFSTRFSAELATSGFSKTLLTGTVILFTSFLITSGLAVPGIVDNVVKSYHKNTNYSNQNQNIDLVGNAPFAKTSLSPWQGPDYYENYMIDTNNYFGKDISQISTSATELTGITDNSGFSKIVISNSKNSSFDTKFEYDWIYNLAINSEKQSSNKNENKVNLLNIIGSSLANNITQLLGKGIALGDIQLLLEWIIHSEYSSEEERIRELNKISNLLTQGLPDLVSKFIPGTSASGEGNWKEQILEIILNETPSYIKNYVTISENRLNQFRFGWTFYNYVPGIDNMYTKQQVIGKEQTLFNITGMKSKQTAFNISDSSIFITDQESEQLFNVLNGNAKYSDLEEEININGIKVYDKKNKTLNIPVITNLDADLNYSHDFKDLSFNTQRLVLNGITNIPNQAWMYDDRDWLKVKDNSTQLTNSNTGWIDANKLQTSKLTYAPVYNYGTSTGFNRTVEVENLIDNSYGFVDIKQEIDEETGILVASEAEIRPYYLYDNVTLFIPNENSLVSGLEAIKAMGNSDSENWYGEISKEQVPESTRRAWEKELSHSINNYIWIKPYSLEFDPREGNQGYNKPNSNFSGKELNQLTDSYKTFYHMALKAKDAPIGVKNVKLDWNKQSKYDLNEEPNVEKINLVKKSTFEIYGDSFILADQDLVNMVSGFDIDKYMPFNYVYEDLENPTGLFNANGTKVETYKKTKPEELIEKDNQQNWIYGKNDFQKSINPNMWFNGVYSNYTEPIMITTQASFSKNPKLGDDLIQGNSFGTTSVELKEIQFLSQQQALITQISNLVLVVAVLFISLIIIVSVLTITLICDLYVNQYKKFMLVMKSLGYSNQEILVYTFGFVSIGSLIAYGIGVGLSYLTIFGVVNYINNTIGVIPFGLTWWSPILGTILIVGVFIISVLITTRKIRTESPTKLLV